MLPTWCHRAGTRVAGVKRARLAPLCRSAPRRRPHTAAPCAQHQHQHQHLQRGGAATETDPLKRLRRVSHMLWGHAKARTLQPSLVRHAAHQGRDALAEVARCTSEAEAFRHAAGLVWALARLRCDALAPDLFGDIVGTSARVALAVLHPAVRDLHRAASRSATERAQRHIRLHLRASCRLLAWAACLTGAPGGAAVAEFLAAVMQASPAMHGDTTAPGAAAGGCARGTWEHLQCWEEAQWYQAHVAMVLSGPDPVATLPPELADKCVCLRRSLTKVVWECCCVGCAVCCLCGGVAHGRLQRVPCCGAMSAVGGRLNSCVCVRACVRLTCWLQVSRVLHSSVFAWHPNRRAARVHVRAACRRGTGIESPATPFSQRGGDGPGLRGRFGGDAATTAAAAAAG